MEFRGPFAAIQTKTPGLRITEHLPMLAKCMDHITEVQLAIA